MPFYLFTLGRCSVQPVESPVEPNDGWQFHRTALVGHRGELVTLTFNGRRASFRAFVEGLKFSVELRARLNQTLADSPGKTFRWETPAVCLSTFDQLFECVIIDRPGLTEKPNPEPFAVRFAESSGAVVTFPNLGRDGLLVVPRGLGDAKIYLHLATFVRGAPPHQQDAFWRAVGDAMAQRVGVAPVWLSTAGGGVAWLHVRLDDRPKYYVYAPYCVNQAG